MNELMNECLMKPQHEKQFGYWVSEKGKRIYASVDKMHFIQDMSADNN